MLAGWAKTRKKTQQKDLQDKTWTAVKTPKIDLAHTVADSGERP